MSNQIDVHHHVAAPEYVADLKARKQNPNMQVFFAHTPTKSIEDMDRGGTATSLLSVNNVWIGDDARAVKLARQCNDFSAKLVADHRGRFAMWGCLPMPVIDGSLKEIEYALDVLKADGIGMMTSYGDDKWLGDLIFLPVMEELNRRKAVVFVHPTAPNCCVNMVPGIPDPAIEFGTDTTRTIASLLFGGTLKRCPDIRFIFSHAGGTMPFLYQLRGAGQGARRQVAQGWADSVPFDAALRLRDLVQPLCDGPADAARHRPAHRVRLGLPVPPRQGPCRGAQGVRVQRGRDRLDPSRQSGAAAAPPQEVARRT